MRYILGIIGVLASIAVGLYVGVWVMFVGGVVGIAKVILGLLAGKLLVGTLALSVIKVLFAGIVGYIAGAFLLIPSLALLHS
jgi:hypothetical protein